MAGSLLHLGSRILGWTFLFTKSGEPGQLYLLCLEFLRQGRQTHLTGVNYGRGEAGKMGKVGEAGEHPEKS